MEWLKRYKLAISGVLVTLLLLGVYAFYFKGGNEVALSIDGGGGVENAAEAELISLLLSLRSVNLDETVFTLPAFRSLVDFSRKLSPEPVGRANPFLPFEPSVVNR